MPFHRIAFLVVILLLGLSAARVAGAADPGVTWEEYRVYSVALREILAAGPVSSQALSRFVIGRETSGSQAVKMRPSQWSAFLKNQMGIEPDGALIGDFIRKNKIPAVVEKKFSDLQVDLFNPRRTVKSELRVDWADFERKYPGAAGLTEFSRVGFSRQGKLALLRVEVSTTTAQIVYTFILGKPNAEWQVEHQAVRSLQKK